MEIKEEDKVTIRGHYPPKEVGRVTKVNTDMYGGVTYDIDMPNGALYRNMDAYDVTKVE